MIYHIISPIFTDTVTVSRLHNIIVRSNLVLGDRGHAVSQVNGLTILSDFFARSDAIQPRSAGGQPKLEEPSPLLDPMLFRSPHSRGRC